MKASALKYIFSAALLTAAATTVAQELNSAYFTQDYKYRHDLNPAFGNDHAYVGLPVISNMNLKLQGNLGVEDLFFQDPATGKYSRTFMHPEVSTAEALAGFKDDNRLQLDMRIPILSFGFKGFGGYNTFEVNTKVNFSMSLPGDLFRFAKDIENKDYMFDFGMHAMGYAEVALGHSHQITPDLRVGAKLKALIGGGRANLEVKGLHAKLTGDEWLLSPGESKAEINIKGIQFQNTTDEYKSKPGTYEHVDLDETDFDGAGIGGFGAAIDLGAEYQVIDGLKVSAAVTDLGFINWSSSTLLKTNGQDFKFSGFHDVAVKDEGAAKGTTIDDQIDDYKDQLSDFMSLQNYGDQGSQQVWLNANINVGVEYAMPFYKKLTVGLLGQHHLAGDFSWSEGRLSLNIAPVKILDASVSYAVNTFSSSIGWVFNFHPKGMNLFFGTDHIITKMTKQYVPLNSNVNVNFGANISF